MMSQLRSILGTSVMSLLLVIWGLFMVCSGRVPDVNYEDDYSMLEGEQNGEDKSDLMAQLAMLDEETTNLEDRQRREILETLGIDPNEAAPSKNQGSDVLSEELFLDLEVEIAELEKMSKRKSSVIDSLQLEIQEANYQLGALGQIVTSPEAQFASAAGIFTDQTVTNGSSSEYAQVYQQALNDFYARNYVEAIAKFSGLLKFESSDDLADNSQYWIGECYYALGNYEVAIAEFEKVFAFEVNNKVDDAQFMIGMAYLRIGEVELAEIEFNSLLSFYQDSEYIARAERKLFDLSI